MKKRYEVRCTATATIGEAWAVDAESSEQAIEIISGDIELNADQSVVMLRDWVIGDEEDRENFEAEEMEPSATPRFGKICSCCGSEKVWKDATACWCTDTQQWVLESINDHEGCGDCGASGNEMAEDKELVS